VGPIDYQHIPPRRGYSKPWDVALPTERWTYISMGGYMFDVDVRDLPTDNRQRSLPVVFIRPSQVPADPDGRNAIVRSLTCSSIQFINEPTFFLVCTV